MDRQTLQAPWTALHHCCPLVAVCGRTASTRAPTAPGHPSGCQGAFTPPTSVYGIYFTAAPCTGCCSPCSIRYVTSHALWYVTSPYCTRYVTLPCSTRYVTSLWTKRYITLPCSTRYHFTMLYSVCHFTCSTRYVISPCSTVYVTLPVPQGMSFHHALQSMSLYHALLSLLLHPALDVTVLYKVCHYLWHYPTQQDLTSPCSTLCVILHCCTSYVTLPHFTMYGSLPCHTQSMNVSCCKGPCLSLLHQIQVSLGLAGSPWAQCARCRCLPRCVPARNGSHHAFNHRRT